MDGKGCTRDTADDAGAVVVHAQYHLVGKLGCLAPRIPFGRIVFWRSMRLRDRFVDTGAASFYVAPLNNL